MRNWLISGKGRMAPVKRGAEGWVLYWTEKLIDRGMGAS